MGIEIALISDVKLQKLATKADDGNGQLETSEISDLLVNMAKKKYNYDDFKQKLEYYLTHEDERLELIKKAKKITLEKFTNEIAAKKFIEVLKNIKK